MGKFYWILKFSYDNGNLERKRTEWVSDRRRVDFTVGFRKPLTRIELVTSPLPRVCSTTELQGRESKDGPSWI